MLNVYEWTGKSTEKIDSCLSGNLCLTKWSQISRQYLANDAFVSAQTQFSSLYHKKEVINQGHYLPRKFDLFSNSVFESYKRKILVFILSFSKQFDSTDGNW